MVSRRDFLKNSSLASVSLMMPGFLKGLRFSSDAADGKKLVIIQFSGGNDGLNTVVPYRNDTYFRSRPGLAIGAGEVLPVSEELGLNPALKDFRSLYDEGFVSVLNNVGYPNPDRSHFRSMDIWHSGSSAEAYWNTGWLGRYMDASCAGCAQPHKVLEIDELLSLAVKGEQSKALALMDPARLQRTTNDPYFHALAAQFAATGATHSDSDYLYKTLAETLQSAAYIHQQSRIYASKIDYPQAPLGRQLKLIAELIVSGAETSVYYVSLSGFDTHVRQRAQQDRLLQQYSESVAAFVKDLKTNGQFDNTLIMTFSEFGRRVEQNASGGTDHGKANNLFLIGGKLRRPGFYNEAPDLNSLDEGDVSYRIDFRQVYASLLHDWLGADDQVILKESFDRLDIV